MKLDIICVIYFIDLTLAFQTRTINVDESWICKVKKNCRDCLFLTHCSWCENENKCFSKLNSPVEDYCQNNTIYHEDFGLSLEDNALCACSGGELERHCHPPGALEDAPECSGRGKCICGRCACDPTPNPDHPTKTVVGEFCEFDNFSCDGPKCNEGPYPLTGVDDGLDDIM